MGRISLLLDRDFNLGLSMEMSRDKEIITAKNEVSGKEGEGDFVLGYRWYALVYQYIPLIWRDEHEEKTRFDDNFSLFVVMKYFFDEEELDKHLKLEQTKKCLKFIFFKKRDKHLKLKQTKKCLKF